jgi:hypothetical protein
MEVGSGLLKVRVMETASVTSAIKEAALVSGSKSMAITRTKPLDGQEHSKRLAVLHA